MKKAIRLQFLITLILSVMSFQSGGFWIGASAIPEFTHIHQTITSDAAKDYKYKPSIDKFNICNENGCTFTGSVIDILKESNKSIDGGSTADNPAYHCDNEKIQECAGIIYNGREEIVDEIIALAKAIKNNGSGSGDMKVAQTILGRISHTLQDFYSHSNWVEREMFGLIVPVFTPYSYSKGTNSTPPVPIYNDLINKNYRYKAPRRTFCETTEKTISSGGTLLHLNSITSGYYEDEPDIYGFNGSSFYDPSDTTGANAEFLSKNGPYYLNWWYDTIGIAANRLYRYPDPKPTDVIEKCQHGSKYNNSAVGNSAHFGIAKDSPNRRHHAAAKLAARTATTELIKAIVADVIEQEGENKYVDAAILAFLGYPVKAWYVDVTDEEGNALADYKLTVLNGNGDEITSYDNSTSEKSDFIFFNTTPLRLGALPDDIKHYKIKVSKEGYKTLETTCPYKNSIPLNGSPINCEVELNSGCDGLFPANGEYTYTCEILDSGNVIAYQYKRGIFGTTGKMELKGGKLVEFYDFICRDDIDIIVSCLNRMTIRDAAFITAFFRDADNNEWTYQRSAYNDTFSEIYSNTTKGGGGGTYLDGSSDSGFRGYFGYDYSFSVIYSGCRIDGESYHYNEYGYADCYKEVKRRFDSLFPPISLQKT